MKILHYLMGATIFIAGIDLILPTHTNNLNACPRCRRALPKGPRKHPHPGFAKKTTPEDSSKEKIQENSQGKTDEKK